MVGDATDGDSLGDGCNGSGETLPMRTVVHIQ